jgi:hypothetical protein
MVLFQNGVRQLRSPAKMAATVQLRCYWKQLWSRWAITGSWEPLVMLSKSFRSCWISNQHQKHKSGWGPSNEHFWQVWFNSSSLAKGYDPLYSSSPLASLDGFS